MLAVAKWNTALVEELQGTKTCEGPSMPSPLTRFDHSLWTVFSQFGASASLTYFSKATLAGTNTSEILSEMFRRASLDHDGAELLLNFECRQRSNTTEGLPQKFVT